MKRNLDLIRHILLVTENSDRNYLHPDAYITEEYQYEEVAYNVLLLDDAGYIILNSVPVISSTLEDFIVERLTNDGHDFLDAIRDKKVFEEAKKKILSVTGSSTLEIFKAVSVSIIKNLLGI